MELMKLLNCRFEDLMLGPDAAPTLLDESYVSIDCHGTDSLAGWTFHTLPEMLRGLGLPRMVRMLRLESAEMMPFAGTGDIVIYDTRSQEVRESGVYVLLRPDDPVGAGRHPGQAHARRRRQLLRQRQEAAPTP